MLARAAQGSAGAFASGIAFKNLDLFDDDSRGADISLDFGKSYFSSPGTDEDNLLSNFRQMLSNSSSHSQGTTHCPEPLSPMPWDKLDESKPCQESFGASTAAPGSFNSVSNSNIGSFLSSFGLPLDNDLDDLEEESVPPPPVANPDWEQHQALPSLGAAKHECGECTPCKFFRGKRGCKDGINCILCHYPHEELTYSGVRRAMRKRGIAKRQMLEEMEAQGAMLPKQSGAPGFRPPPGLEHLVVSSGFPDATSAMMAGSVAVAF
mmetsp:Transcript_96460/g.201537  ORF Transcript_96460/g.201537 Transcript_96460/m.201537 type:complete len:265 (-) Transcript_96460:112-906(-)